MEYVLAVLLVVVVSSLLVLPVLIASKRNHPNFKPIILLTFFGLIFFPCWVIALVWSVMKIDRVVVVL